MCVWGGFFTHRRGVEVLNRRLLLRAQESAQYKAVPLRFWRRLEVAVAGRDLGLEGLNRFIKRPLVAHNLSTGPKCANRPKL